MGRPPKRKSGKPLTGAERVRDHRAKKEKALKEALDAERRAKRNEVTANLAIHKLAIADIGEADLASESVDAIITDPPYAEADLQLYRDLAALAMRALKPSGWCLAMVGDLYLDRIPTLMTGEGLVFRGIVTIAFPGSPHSRIGTTKTFQAAKLMLVLQKPPTCQPPHWGPNFIISAPKNGHDKSLHPWQQSQPAFEKLIEHFTCEGDLIADPFAGSGTTLRAALALSRKTWGCDVDANAEGRTP